MVKGYSFVCKLYLFAIAAFLFVAGCNSAQSDPPVTITFRSGVLSDFVLQISNMSSQKSLEVYLYVADDTHSVRSGNFILHPNTTKEFGALEMDWHFKRGDHGFVSVGGMEKKLFFRVAKNGEYRTWFGMDDIPEVDVAVQVRARREAAAAAGVQTLKNGVMAFVIRYPETRFTNLKQLVEGDDDHPPIIDGGKEVLLDPWGNKYRYVPRGKRFAIVSPGADGKEGTEDDIRSDKAMPR